MNNLFEHTYPESAQESIRKVPIDENIDVFERESRVGSKKINVSKASTEVLSKLIVKDMIKDINKKLRKPAPNL